MGPEANKPDPQPGIRGIGGGKVRADFAVHAIAMGFMVGFICLIEMARWLTGGGLSSVAFSMKQIENGAQLVRVDGISLLAPIMVGLTVGGWLVIWLFRVRISPRSTGIAFALLVFGGGFLLDGLVEPPAMAKFMAAHGYSRCLAQDHHSGSGKSRVWLEAYVMSGQGCVAGEQR